MKNSLWLCGAAVLLLAGVGSAEAAQRPGLWNMTMRMPGMPEIPQIPPEALAQMRALGIQVPGGASGGGITMQVCVTPSMAATEEVPPAPEGCRHENITRDGNTFRGGMVCDSAQMKGTGTFEATTVSDQHFTSKVSFKGTMNGQPADMMTDFEGRWQAADCGNVRPITP